MSIPDRSGHGEERWTTIGLVGAVVLLVVIHTYVEQNSEEIIRIISAPKATRRGTLTFRGNKVEPRAIRRTMLLRVEGERDDICAAGQTVAAQELCTSLRPYLKRHHLQLGVGHYGIFSGKRWELQVYPLVKNVILASD